MQVKFINRDMTEKIKKASQEFPAVILIGPRQSGKTTLLKHLFSKTHTYISLDDPNIKLLANNDPDIFFQNYKLPLIIDEIQYAPNLFSYIKKFIDENRQKKGQFILTGSQSFPLMANVTESLAGRIAIFNLLPLSVKEIMAHRNKKISLDELKTIVLTGGFPEIVVDKNRDIQMWFKSYLNTYLERDIRNLRQIGNMLDFQRFLELIAYLNGQVLNLSSIARDLGVAVNTIKIWLSILETSNQIVLIKPFFRNKGKRITKSPKLYFLDTGLVCFLNGITDINQIFKGPLAGQLLETLVLTEIIKNFYNNGELARVFWWRTSNGIEIDFILQKKDKLIPIEIKLTSSLNKMLCKNLEIFFELFKEDIDKCLLINLAENNLKINSHTQIISIYDFIVQSSF
jgi:hypothetical protein